MSDRRIHLRFDKVFSVVVASDDFGESGAVARNISAGGMFVEMADPLPLGSQVTVHFDQPEGGGEIAARAEVQHHYSFNFGDGEGPTFCRGIGLRFVEFLRESPRRWLSAQAPLPRIWH
jgi:hypothetical protein